MYCLAVIMCQSCTSGMWGRVPGRLVWSSRLVYVYLTAPHSCVLCKCNRRRPHPSEKPPPPPIHTQTRTPSSPLLSPPPIFRSSASIAKMSANREGVVSGVNLWIVVLAQLFSLFKRVCISEEVPHKPVIQAQHMLEGLWQHRHNQTQRVWPLV